MDMKDAAMDMKDAAMDKKDAAMETFHKMDANGDGKLNKEELKKT